MMSPGVASDLPFSVSVKGKASSCRCLVRTTLLVSLMSWMVQVGVTEAEDAFSQHEVSTVPGFVHDIDGDPVTVSTTSGDIRGKRRIGDARAGGVTTTVDWFLGIPYAKPPIGDRRFKRPESLNPWTPRVRDAFRYGSSCPQVDYVWYARPSFQNEDCLYLNIYSPHQWDETKEVAYPVMVFIHGGSYKVGGGNIYQGQLLAQHGVVVVTINYRLGILGFLSAMEPELEGNYGLLDQIMALKWIKKNIRSFGGNPDEVTVFGNSAGGASVGLLCVMPMAKGLFSKAIVQSGSPLAFWAVHNETADRAKYVRALASALSCNRQHMTDLVTCLRDVDWRKFVWTTSDDHGLEAMLPRISPMGFDDKPVIDGKVIPMSPLKLMEDGVIIPRAVMTGIVEDEWSRLFPLFLDDLPNPQKYHYMETELSGENFDELLRHVLCQRFGYDKIIKDLAKQEYTDWERPGDDRQNIPQYLKFGSDLVFLAPTILMADVLHKRNIPTFLYLFNHHQNRSKVERQNYHQRELSYLFGSPFDQVRVLSDDIDHYDDQDREVSKLMMKMWTNFATTGSPSKSPIKGNGDGFVETALWSTYDPSNASYVEIGNGSVRPMQHLRTGKMKFWNHVIPGVLERLNERVVEGNSLEKRFSIGIWILIGFSILQFVLLLALFVLVLKRREYKQ